MNTEISCHKPGVSLVFHDRRPLFGFGDYQKHFPDDYECVAEVETAELGLVFQLTNHIDQPWMLNEQAKALVSQPRSTSVGDIVVTSDGVAHLCMPLGWEELGPVADITPDNPLPVPGNLYR